MTVVHLVEASGGDRFMFGKEKVIHWLMREQRSGGIIDPRLVTFSPCLMADVVKADGFAVEVLEEQHHTVPSRALRRLASYLQHVPRPLVLHTHGYKANIVGRLANVGKRRVDCVVSTCHGFIDETLRLRAYNVLDRFSAVASSIVTAPDPSMLRKFPRFTRTMFVPNAIPDAPKIRDSDRADVRRDFGWSDDRFVAGMLGRFSREKGIANFIGAAMQSGNPAVLYAAAGAGAMEADLRQASGQSLAVIGYVSPSERYLAALDAYVQPSYTEGLSLSLLEAMRAALPIVATRVGATEAAIRDGIEGLLVPPEPSAIEAAVTRLSRDPELANRLGAAARRRFVEAFRIDVMQRTFFDLYNGRNATSR
jgi:glycosyltransferase involved in cell wall biosynthesis